MILKEWDANLGCATNKALSIEFVCVRVCPCEECGERLL